MTAEHALTQKKTIKLNRLMARPQDDAWDALPVEFRELADRANGLQRRVSVWTPKSTAIRMATPARSNRTRWPLQQSLLQSAFDKRFDD